MNFSSASNYASAAVSQFNKTEDGDKVDEAALGNDPNKIAAANKVLELKRQMKDNTTGVTDALGMNKDKSETPEGGPSMLEKFTAPVQDAFRNVQSHLPAGMGGDNKGSDETEKKDSGFPGAAAVTNLYNSMGGENKGDEKKDSGFPGAAAVTNLFKGDDNKGDDKKASGFPGAAAVSNLFNSFGGDNKGDDKKDSGFPGAAAVTNLFNNKGGESSQGEDNIISQTMKKASTFASDANERIQGAVQSPAGDNKTVDDEVVNVSDFLTKPTFTSPPK